MMRTIISGFITKVSESQLLDAMRFTILTIWEKTKRGERMSGSRNSHGQRATSRKTNKTGGLERGRKV